MTPVSPHPASFRDPHGFVFLHDGIIHRHVSAGAAGHLAFLEESGLYLELSRNGQLVEHEEADPAISPGATRVLRPRPIPFVSYPYEWSFGQLKAAALLTLDIQRAALERGMSLRDASAFNIQFRGWRPELIDTLSFERAVEGRPWVAYGQFCRHFLASLALMSGVDLRLNELLLLHLDGVPLELASALLPFRTRLRPSLLFHIHAHAKSQARFASIETRVREGRLSRAAQLGLLDNLRSAVASLSIPKKTTEWGSYYEDIHYPDTAIASKRQIVSAMLLRADARVLWDVGGNTGVFSRIGRESRELTISLDLDPIAVHRNYEASVASREENLLPLRVDLMNPTPAAGWNHSERASLAGRGPADAVMALALVHHLALANNVPLPLIAGYLSELTRRHLLIEFVPKHDPQSAKLLLNREDIFPAYTEEAFTAVFEERFRIIERQPVADSPRVMFLMEKR